MDPPRKKAFSSKRGLFFHGKVGKKKGTQTLAGLKKALRPFSVERLKPDSGTYSGRFGSDFGAPPGCISNFWPVTPIFVL